MGNSPTPPGLIERIMQMVDERIAAFARSGFLRNATITEGGLTIKGGRLRVLFPESLGSGLGVYFGDIYSVVDGTYQGTGLLVQDADGTDIVTFRSDPASGNPLVVLRDGTENAVLYTDTTTGIGFGRPWFPGAFYPSRNTDWPSVSSATFETVYRAKLSKQNPKLLVRAWGANDTAGATGEIRVLVNNVQLGATASTVSGVVAEKLFFDSVAGAFGSLLVVEIQARLASGAGAVQVGQSELTSRN